MNPQNPALSAAPARPHKPISKPIVATGIASTVVIGAGAFVLSFSALTDLAVRAGINPEIGWLWPLIVDGMIVAATVAIVALAGREGKEQFYPWILLFFGAVVSTAANSIHAILAVKASNGNVPVVVSALVAAMPPVVLLAITHLTVLLVQYARNSAEKEAELAAAEEIERALAERETVVEVQAAVAAGAASSSVGGVSVVETVLDENAVAEAEAEGSARPVPRARKADTAQIAVVDGDASKAKPAPKRKPRKPAGAPATAAGTAAAATPGGGASGTVAKTARPAARNTSAPRQLMPELSTVTGVNPILRPTTTAGAATSTANGSTATAGATSAAGETTPVRQPAPSSATDATRVAAPSAATDASGPDEAVEAKELVSAQA